jgi:hypothetical protein
MVQECGNSYETLFPSLFASFCPVLRSRTLPQALLKHFLRMGQGQPSSETLEFPDYFIILQVDRAASRIVPRV